jgi:hypothetical protein
MPEPAHHPHNVFESIIAAIVGFFSSFFYHLPSWEKVESSMVLAIITGTVSFFVMSFWKFVFKKRRKKV